MTGTTTDPSSARDKLLQQISEAGDLPALGASVSQVVRIASSEENSVRELSAFLLRDVGLTQKVLRLSNTVNYRRASGAPVSTISRAIFLLGFDTIKTNALALMLADRIRGKRGEHLRRELALSLAAGVIGREMARRGRFRDGEEAAIAALFRNLGRVLVAAHDEALYARIAALSESGALSPSQASARVLGCSFDMLADAVLRGWDMPDSLVGALAPLPAGRLKPARGRAEWLQQVAHFSGAMAAALTRMTEPGTDAHSKALLERYGAALELDAATLAALFAAANEEARLLASNAEVAFDEDGEDIAAGALLPADEPTEVTSTAATPAASAPPPTLSPDSSAINTAAKHASATPDALAGLVLDAGDSAPSDGCHASGKPLAARDMLLAGAQGVTEMIASGKFTLNDLMFQVLETLYASLGFRFATFCLRDVQTGLYRSRVALGETTPKLPKRFAFAASGAKDLFHLALQNDADLFIADATSMKIVNLLPTWHRNLVPEARSLMILPLVVGGNSLGYYYADRTATAPEGITTEESALIKMLKRQVLAVMAAR
ncbi:HDOD domain-containing protein [Noviherbaspirillum pedocola]|uniref:HDOD domain-containing protein n=1 Tax=Noviherbaspirillum pedocola TaxID=2801341 RepID=A0A934SZK7_9BURK|nr:HDOD domain-containing protein [Noviherbaspirillum pedocola]MBK4735614.1 HDOD domain-containing protein [Noviherbaspirillum pedocola]